MVEHQSLIKSGDVSISFGTPVVFDSNDIVSSISFDSLMIK